MNCFSQRIDRSQKPNHFICVRVPKLERKNNFVIAFDFQKNSALEFETKHGGQEKVQES